METRGEPAGVKDPGVECGIAMCGVAVGLALGRSGNGAEACEEDAAGAEGAAGGTVGIMALRGAVD